MPKDKTTQTEDTQADQITELVVSAIQRAVYPHETTHFIEEKHHIVEMPEKDSGSQTPPSLLFSQQHAITSENKPDQPLDHNQIILQLKQADF